MRVLQRRVSRRRAVVQIVVGSAGLMVAGCAPPAPPAPTAAPPPPTSPPAAAVPTAAQSRPTEAPKPAAAATAAPKPAAATTVAPAAPAAKPAGDASSPGRALVGDWEGPEVVVDPAKLPRTFAESPLLAQLVKEGTLPPVAERIGQDPLVIKPVHELGRYGGTWRRGFTGPGDKWNGYRAATGPDHLLFWDYTGEAVVPNIARGFEMQDDGKVLVLHLRRGMRWSDGEPFTADDFMFWFEDVYQNKSLRSTPTSYMSINGKPGRLEKQDASTVRYVFPEPYYMLPDILAGATSLASQSEYGHQGLGSYAPAHYLKQFHPKYVPEEELNQKARAENFDNWVSLFTFKSDWALNPDLPVLTPWKTATPVNTPTWTLERNPYSIWVDTDGNQLPYIDRIQMTLAENLEIVNLRAIAGEYDWQERHLDIGKLPVFLENQQRGGYKVYLDPNQSGGDMNIRFNMSYDGDPEAAKWFGTTDFRRALSLGVDRDQLNETFWLGTGSPGAFAPAPANKYSPGPDARKLWATYDPDRANAMLDAIGLDKKDAEGFRLRSDGGGRLHLEATTRGGQFIQFTQIMEMVRDQWKKIGIDLAVKEVERSLGDRMSAANELQLSVWQGDGSEHLFTFPTTVFPFEVNSSGGPLYGRWFQSGGAEGREPPPRMQELMAKFLKAFGVPEAERVQLGKEIWQIALDEVYAIGTVGLSPAAGGTRIVKTGMGNVPAGQYNSPDGKTPGVTRPATFFWKA